MRKLIDKLFKCIGYLPANDVITPKHIVLEHTKINYTLVQCVERVNVVEWADDVFKEHVKQYVKMQLAREITKHIDVISKDGENLYEVELHAKLFVAK